MNLKKIDEAAKMWHKTKDTKYKKLWYKLIEEWYGRTSTLSATNNTDSRRNLYKGITRV